MIVKCDFYSCSHDVVSIYNEVFPTSFIKSLHPILPFKTLVKSLEPLTKNETFCKKSVTISEVDYLLINYEDQPCLCAYCYSNLCIYHLLTKKYIKREMLHKHIDMWSNMTRSGNCMCNTNQMLCEFCRSGAILHNMKSYLYYDRIYLNYIVNKLYDEKEKYEW